MELFSRVKLNIGGTTFETTKSTLVKYNGFFKTMLETDNPVKPDENGCIFLDRDPTHFRLILNFMRDDHVDLPESMRAVREIRKEADFYMLDGLKDLCQSLLIPDDHGNIRLLDDTTNIFLLTVNAVKPIMIVHYETDNQGDVIYPEGFQASSFVAKYQDRFDVYFKPAKSEQWEWSLYNPGCAWRSNDFDDKNFPEDVEQSEEEFFGNVNVYPASNISDS